MSQKGQLTVEYLMVLAIIVVVLLFLTRRGGNVQDGLNKTVQQQAKDINAMADKIFK